MSTQHAAEAPKRSRAKSARAPRTDLAPLAVDLDEAGRLLGDLCRRNVEYLIKRGELASFKIGARRLVRIAEIDRYLIERERAAASECAA